VSHRGRESLTSCATIALHLSQTLRWIGFVPKAKDNAVSDGVGPNWHLVRLQNRSILYLFAGYDRGSIYLRLVNKSLAALTKLTIAVNANAQFILTATLCM
jgi:hypothetical protein